MNKQGLIERLEKASNVKNWHYEDLSTELLDITYELRNVFEQLDEPSREECVMEQVSENESECSNCSHLINCYTFTFDENYEMSVDGYDFYKINYCPNCGAKLREQIEQQDHRIAELKKEVEGLNTKLKIWNRFNSEDYMHKGENVTDRDYYYYTNGASSVLENDLKYYKQENEKLKQQLAEKDKLLENAIVPKFKVGDEVWYISHYNEVYCEVIENISYLIKSGISYYLPNLQRPTFYIKENELFATKQEAEEALKKLNKE